MTLDHPLHLAADAATGAVGGVWITASLLDAIDGGERVIAGLLVIVLLALRIRSHLRRERAGRDDGH